MFEKQEEEIETNEENKMSEDVLDELFNELKTYDWFITREKKLERILK